MSKHWTCTHEKVFRKREKGREGGRKREGRKREGREREGGRGREGEREGLTHFEVVYSFIFSSFLNMLRSGCGTLGLASLFVGGLYFSILIEKGPENVGIPERGLVFVLITADSGNTGGEGEGVLALILRKKNQ